MLKEPTQGNVLAVGSRATLGLSVICPFYNESQILEVALRGLLDKLQELTVDWESHLTRFRKIAGIPMVAEIFTVILKLRLPQH